MIYMYIICIFFKITPKNHTCTYGIKESLDFYLVLKTEVVNAIKKFWMHFLKESTLSAEHVNI